MCTHDWNANPVNHYSSSTYPHSPHTPPPPRLPTLPIDPELQQIRDRLFPHLASAAASAAADWPDALAATSAANATCLIAKWQPEVESLKHRTAPDGTGWRGLYIKALFNYGKKEFSVFLELIDTHDLPFKVVEFLKSNSLIALLKPDSDGNFSLNNPKIRPIGKQNRFQTLAFRPHARLVGKYAGPFLGANGQMAMLKSGIESTPRQLAITRDRHPFAVKRSEDAINAFPSLLRAAVLSGHRALQAALQALIDAGTATDQHRTLLAKPLHKRPHPPPASPRRSAGVHG